MCCVPTHLPALRPWALPGLIPCISTHASQVGAVLGELVAAGGADLKVLAVHIRTADANPDEIQVRRWLLSETWACWLPALAGGAVCSEHCWRRVSPPALPTPAQPPLLLPQFLVQEGEDTMLVGGGGAAKTMGALLQRLAAGKGEEAAREAWQATGEALPAFLPQADRESEEERSKVVEQFGLAAIVA